MEAPKRWSDLIGRRLFWQPFKKPEDPFEPWEGIDGGCDFKQHSSEVLTRTVGDPPDMRKLAAVLWEKLHIDYARQEELYWPDIVRLLDRLPKTPGPESAQPHGGRVPNKEGWEIPWDEDNRDFIKSGQARIGYTDCRLPGSTLSERLGTIPVHYMRKRGKGSRVHEKEFEAWARQEYPQANLTDEQREEIADEIEADRQATKRLLRTK